MIASCFLVIGAFSCIQENLKQLLLYTIIGHLGYLSIMVYNTIAFHPVYHELLHILFFYIIFMTNVTVGFFYCALSMKRSGGTYQVKSIYDFTQLWLTNKKITLSFLVLLTGLSGLPFFPGFMCRWFLIEETFLFNKLLGLVSFFMCFFSAYPYIRIMINLVFNKNLMLNQKGPRWYFDTLLDTPRKMVLGGTAFLCAIMIIDPSIVWFIIHHLSTYLPLIYK
jgi:NADH:ubiquinone oxidoreductase subunit 2 (subunit N)